MTVPAGGGGDPAGPRSRDRRRLAGGALALLAALAAAPGAASASAPARLAPPLDAARAPAAELAPQATARLPGGTIVRRFAQRVGGVPVLGAAAVVADPAAAAPSLVADSTRVGLRAPLAPAVSRQRAIASSRGATGAARLGRAPRATLAIEPGAGGTLVWRVLLSSRRPAADYEVLVDAATGRVIGRRDLTRRSRTGHAQLYNPNPVAEQGGFKGLRHDRGDRDSRRLTRLRMPVALRDLDAGQRCLRGRWAHVELGRGRRAHEVCKPGLDWRGVTRSDNRFEALMAYFHIDRSQRYVQRLGFRAGSPGVSRGINQRAQVAIADSLRKDNSEFLPRSRRIKYGTGGVDDAEDGDIIVHEYGHALQNSQLHFFGSGLDAGSIGEGFGDYWAAAMSSLSPRTRLEDDVCIFDWDATSYWPQVPGNPFPPVGSGGRRYCGRRTDSTRTLSQAKSAPDCQYAPGPQGLDVHCVGTVWASALWRLRVSLGDDAAGKSIVDRDVLASQFLYTSDAEHFPAAAAALEGADELLYPAGAPNDGQGQHYAAIHAEMAARGLL